MGEMSKNERLRMMGHALDLVNRGFSDVEVIDRLGLGGHTLSWWKSKYPRFKRGYEKAKVRYNKWLIQNGFDRLAKGADEEDFTEEYMGTKVLKDGSEVPCKFIRKVRRKAPSEKALMALARKYMPDEYEKAENKEELTIRITQRNRSLSLDERIKLLEKEGNEVIEVNDFRQLGELGGADGIDKESK